MQKSDHGYSSWPSTCSRSCPHGAGKGLWSGPTGQSVASPTSGPSLCPGDCPWTQHTRSGFRPAPKIIIDRLVHDTKRLLHENPKRISEIKKLGALRPRRKNEWLGSGRGWLKVNNPKSELTPNPATKGGLDTEPEGQTSKNTFVNPKHIFKFLCSDTEWQTLAVYRKHGKR